MTTPTEDEARAEAFKRYDGDRIIDENTGEEVSHDDWGYAETARHAFIAGVEWAASRVSSPPTNEEVEALIVRLTELVDDAIQENKYVQSERSDLGPAEDWEEERVAMRAVRDDVIAALRRQVPSTAEPEYVREKLTELLYETYQDAAGRTSKSSTKGWPWQFARNYAGIIMAGFHVIPKGEA
jgi:hypothetical protein